MPVRRGLAGRRGLPAALATYIDFPAKCNQDVEWLALLSEAIECKDKTVQLCAHDKQVQAQDELAVEGGGQIGSMTQSSIV